jgi:hypothetical protein
VQPPRHGACGDILEGCGSGGMTRDERRNGEIILELLGTGFMSLRLAERVPDACNAGRTRSFEKCKRPEGPVRVATKTFFDRFKTFCVLGG